MEREWRGSGEWMDGWMDGWMNEWMNEYMNEWMNEKAVKMMRRIEEVRSKEVKRGEEVKNE